MIYLARHGETEFNVLRRLQGQCDSPLTPRGRDQARRMGLTLAGMVDLAATVIFSSPLGRARQSAEIIAETIGFDGDITFDPDLMEVRMGSWDGLTEFEIDQEWPGAREGTDRHNWYFHSPDGETHEAFTSRLAQAMDRVSRTTASTRIVVSHGVCGRVIRGRYEDLDDRLALRLDAPQDAIFRLVDGKAERLEIAG